MLQEVHYIYVGPSNFIPGAISGTLKKLWAIVDATGSVEDVRIARALGIGFDEAAVAAVKTWRFRPATKDGHPVAVQVDLNIDFRLQ